jgi:hypothetical protein
MIHPDLMSRKGTSSSSSAPGYILPVHLLLRIFSGAGFSKLQTYPSLNKSAPARVFETPV